VQNLGSVVVRLVFWPIEKGAYRAFSETTGGQVSTDDNKKGPDASVHRHIPQLQLLLRIVMLCACLACSFGPSYSFSAIHVLLTSRWSSTTAPAVLGAYCFYLLFLAVNGVSEAYIHARMTPSELLVSNLMMVAIVVAQTLCILGAHQLGESCIALVVIDCASMAARIAVAVWYIYRWHKGYHGPWTAWMPSPASLLALACAAAVLHVSNRAMQSHLDAFSLQQRLPVSMRRHIAVGICTLGVVLLLWCWTERAILVQLRPVVKRHKD
jgi:oligosaccharide translocation protein RFT1